MILILNLSIFVFFGYKVSQCRNRTRTFVPYSSIGSSEKSVRLSAPQTDHRFLSFLVPNPAEDLLLLSTSSSPAAERRFASSSASILAASSASGVSGIVSRELIDGERDLKDVGVLGILDAEL
jgi:hypothetical protein